MEEKNWGEMSSPHEAAPREKKATLNWKDLEMIPQGVYFGKTWDSASEI